MKKNYIGFAGLSLLLALGTQQVQAQQGFGTDKPHKTAAVDIQSSKRGLLIPRVKLEATTNGTTPINTPAQSLMVYNEATTEGVNNVTPGYYYWDTDRWVRFAKQSEITAISTLGGDVTGPTNATVVGAIQGVEVSNVNPTANQVLTFDATEGKWKPVSLTETNLTSSKGITGTGITVGGETNGANSTLKNVTLAITPGDANYVMVTNAAGDGTTWVPQSTIAPATTHTIVKDATGNTITSTVNGVEATTDIIANVSNTITNNTVLNTTVNGQTGQLDLGPVIQAGQKITTVVDGLNTTVTSTVDPVSTNTIEYQVNVSKDAIQSAQKTSVVAEGTGITVTPSTTEEVTTYTVAANPSEIALGGDVTGNVGETVVGAIQGTGVNSLKPTAGQTLVYNTVNDQWVPGTPNVGVTNITDSKTLTTDGVIVIGDNSDSTLVTQEHALLAAVKLNIGKDKITANHIATGAVTSDEILDGTIQPGDVAALGNKGEVLTVVDKGEEGKSVVWKKVAPQFFYMPAVIFNTKTTGTNLKRDLYQDYVNQFTTTRGTAYNIAHGANGGSLPYDGGVIGSTNAPAIMDVFGKRELHYYVTYYDKNVFANISIDEDGVLKYDIIGTATPASYMNIVFVIK